MLGHPIVHFPASSAVREWPSCEQMTQAELTSKASKTSKWVNNAKKQKQKQTVERVTQYSRPDSLSFWTNLNSPDNQSFTNQYVCLWYDVCLAGQGRLMCLFGWCAYLFAQLLTLTSLLKTWFTSQLLIIDIIHLYWYLVTSRAELPIVPMVSMAPPSNWKKKFYKFVKLIKNVSPFTDEFKK